MLNNMKYIEIYVIKIKWSWEGTPTASKTSDGPRVSPRGDHTTRKDDKGDQPSGGETTLTNTGATQSGRGQHTKAIYTFDKAY